jgi:FAD:protein FMN transferase
MSEMSLRSTSPGRWALAALLLASPLAASATTIKNGRAKMGSPFEITVVAADEATAWRAVEAGWAEIDRIEELISSWRETSETSAINRAAGGEPVHVSRELYDLVARSIKVSRLTGGAFDVTFGAVGRLWDLKADPPRLPDPAAIAAALELVDYRAIELDADAPSVHLAKPGMLLGWGAIGKGYAANRAVGVLRSAGALGGLVNAGGDIVAFGRQEDGSPWRIAIAHPLRPQQVFAFLEVENQAVVTSGDYERYVEIGGVRYAHIIDPRTGWPVRGVRSVTVVCPDGELADALATATFVMGVTDGLALIDRLNGVEAMVVDDEGVIHYSQHLEQRIREVAAP